MAHLRDRNGQLFPVETSHIVGRSRSMSTSISAPEVSAQHLAITWDGTEWSLRDLASRNGTWVNGRKLTPGESVRLQAGAELGVGSATVSLTLVDDEPPCAFAVNDGLIIEGGADLLAIPNPEMPLLLLELDAELGWVLLEGDEKQAVKTGARVEVGDQVWRVLLPEPVVRTTDARVAPSTGTGLRFRVSSNEEYIETSVLLNGVFHPLAARIYHEILLSLARSRLEDTALSVNERGWVYTADLMKMLRLSSNQLYVGLHRIRKEFEAIDKALGASLIERRPTSHQIRIALDDLRVEPI